MGKASRAKKLRRHQRAGIAALQTTMAAMHLFVEQGRERDRRFAEVVGSWWGGEAAPAAVPDWPEGSLGDRLWSDGLFRSALVVPPLEAAKVPDPETIRNDPDQWGVAAWVLVRAVVLDGLGVQDPAVSALVATLAPVVETELAANDAAAAEARSSGLDPGAISPDFPDGPVWVIGCGALIQATWAVIGNDPLAEVLDMVSPLVDRAAPGRGRPVAEALVGAFADHYACEEADDLVLLGRLDNETSGDPLRDLVSAGVLPPADVLPVGLAVLSELADLCKTASASILDLPAR